MSNSTRQTVQPVAARLLSQRASLRPRVTRWGTATPRRKTISPVCLPGRRRPRSRLCYARREQRSCLSLLTPRALPSSRRGSVARAPRGGHSVSLFVVCSCRRHSPEHTVLARKAFTRQRLKILTFNPARGGGGRGEDFECPGWTVQNLKCAERFFLRGGAVNVRTIVRVPRANATIARRGNARVELVRCAPRALRATRIGLRSVAA